MTVAPRENNAASPSGGIAPTMRDSLAQLHREGARPFDLIFIDADKPNNALYLDWALRLSKPGTLIVVDNVIRDGRVLDPHRPEKLEFIRYLGQYEGLQSTVVQTVGAKGWDGFVLARKL